MSYGVYCGKISEKALSMNPIMPAPLVTKPSEAPLTLLPGAVSLEEAKNGGSTITRDFNRVAGGSTALSFGLVLGALASLRDDASGFGFQWSGGTAPAFVIGALLGWVYWNLVSRSAMRRASPALRVASSLVALGGVGAFLYPLRFAPAGNLAEALQGLAMVAVLLAFLGFMLWRIKGYFDHDAAQAGGAAADQ